MKGLFDDIDVNLNKFGGIVVEKNNRLRKFMKVIDDLKFGKYEDNIIDVFGDVYEFLMIMYVVNVGKFGGEFFIL